MNVKRVIGILLLIAGVFVIFYSNYLKAEIAAAGGKAYREINQGTRLFGGSAFGGEVSSSLKKKTASEMARYRQMVQYLLMGGIVVAIVGGAMVILCHDKKTKKKGR
jgi:hypothetical protein